MGVKDDVGKQECGLVDNMRVYCERREAATAGHVGFKIKNAHTLRTSAQC